MISAFSTFAETFEPFSVTVGTDPGISYGFIVGPGGVSFGAISPANYRSKQIVVCETVTSSRPFRFWLAGILTQSYFSRIEVEDTAGVIQTFYSSAAIFITGPISAGSYSGPGSAWDWSTGSNVWTATGGPKIVRVYY